MDKKKKPQSATYFKYQFTPLMVVLAIGVLLLCGVGIGISVWRIYKFGIHGFTDTLQSPFLIAVCLFCIVLVVALLIKSQYIIDDTHYTLQFGFIKSKFLIKEITALHLDTTTKKLTVYVGEQFSVITLNAAWQDDFIAALRKVNPDAEFTF